MQNYCCQELENSCYYNHLTSEYYKDDAGTVVFSSWFLKEFCGTVVAVVEGSFLSVGLSVIVESLLISVGFSLLELSFDGFEIHLVSQLDLVHPMVVRMVSLMVSVYPTAFLMVSLYPTAFLMVFRWFLCVRWLLCWFFCIRRFFRWSICWLFRITKAFRLGVCNDRLFKL